MSGAGGVSGAGWCSGRKGRPTSGKCKPAILIIKTNNKTTSHVIAEQLGMRTATTTTTTTGNYSSVKANNNNNNNNNRVRASVDVGSDCDGARECH